MNEIARRFGRNLAHLFIVVGMLIVVLSFGIIDQNKESVNRPAPVGSPAYEIERCTPANDDPIEYALIQRLNSGVERVTSDRLIGKALDKALAGKEWNNVRVIGFCK
jgi:hypothetical protein